MQQCHAYARARTRAAHRARARAGLHGAHAGGRREHLEPRNDPDYRVAMSRETLGGSRWALGGCAIEQPTNKSDHTAAPPPPLPPGQPDACLSPAWRPRSSSSPVRRVPAKEHSASVSPKSAGWFTYQPETCFDLRSPKAASSELVASRSLKPARSSRTSS
jgi:hypothetical protein